ncbi:type I restriction endonuclease subunit S [Spirochaetia bacterium]|nr:type I restriction endonuclease subunit S [Spirochaetia bacterium]
MTKTQPRVTARQLKSSILQMAVEGKLVPQDPKDEPASVLLEKIKREKNRKGAEGEKGRKRSADSHRFMQIKDDEIPYDLPKGWEWVRLGDIGDWGAGATPPRDNPAFYQNGKIPWLKTGDLNDGYITDIPEKITSLALEKTSVRLNPIGSVLIAMYGATIGKLGILKIEATTNQACCACLPFTGIYNKYLFYYLFSQKHSFEEKSEGGAQPNISKKKIISHPFSLPPLAEQKRIVTKIEKLMPLVGDYDKAEQKLTTLNANFPELLKKAVLQDAVQGKLVPQDLRDESVRVLLERIRAEKKRLIKKGKIRQEKPIPPINEDEVPYDLPRGWVWVRLGFVGDWGSGATPPRNNPAYYYNGTIPWLKTGDLNDDYITEIPEKITILALEKTSVRLNPIGSVLIAMYGATIGKLGILTMEAATNQACCACLPHTGVYNKYLFYFLLSQKSSFEEKSEGGAQPNISKEKIVSHLFPLPPLAEQKRIVERIEQVFKVIGELGEED